MLNSVNVAVLGSLFTFGAVDRPKGLGIQDYGGGVKTLGLCPPSPNCISTAEEANDPGHYVPTWTYNPEDGRGGRNAASQEQAMSELVSVVKALKPDKFEPKIVKQTADFLYVEYQSPTFGFIDDVEFWFPPGKCAPFRLDSAHRLWLSTIVAEPDHLLCAISKGIVLFGFLQVSSGGWVTVGNTVSGDTWEAGMQERHGGVPVGVTHRRVRWRRQPQAHQGHPEGA